ncbi:RNase P subunit RPR2 [Sphingomonas faeni]|nr:RNase P subunit RPR2 [Sphingomonas faeni]
MVLLGGDDCHIEFVPQPRGGRSKFWCFAHEASATARYGGRLPRCEGAYRSIANYKRFVLDPDRYAGGVALWGAVEPVYNSTSMDAERGIHVHARRANVGPKEIDQTFDAVELTVRKDLLEEETVVITRDTAVAYYLSRFLNNRMRALFCHHCGTPHLDSDWFAVKPHRTHLCHGCNKLFREPDRSISNPLEAVRMQLGHRDPAAVPKRAKQSLLIRQADYPGGLQIWASNPALLWTANKSEEEGIHVHGWKGRRAAPELDGTFDRVVIDDINLNEEYLRHFMAQNALAYMRGKITSIQCPQCGEDQFDSGLTGFRPTRERTCQKCQEPIIVAGRRRLLVANPFVDTLKALNQARRAKGAPWQ